MSKAIGFELSMVLVALFSTICCACVGLISNWKLTFAIICIIPFAIIGSYAFAKVTAKESRNELVAYSKAGEEKNTSMNETQISQGSVSFQEAININGDIQFDKVNFAYPARSDVLVLRNLTLTARAGETTALVGSSGSGKSTCVSLLLRFYEPLSGCIIINGRSITDCNFKPLRQNIGVVSQEPVLFATSIYENIRFGKENATRAEIEEAARQANAHNFIMQLPNKYGTIVGERGVQLSGGEKQRVALARALVKRPALLLLDEATSALDNTNEMVVQKALDQACKGRTTVVIAHRLSAVQNAHRIYVLDNGCVIEQGTHEALMSQEGSRYCEMMKAQESEKAENDIDEKTSTAPIEDDDQKQISGHSLHPSHSEFDDDNKASSDMNCRPVFLRLLFMNSPEWIIILIGCMACLIIGASQTIHAILLKLTVSAFGACTYEERKHQILKFSLLFLLMGIVLLAIRFIQYTAFAISGSKLVERIRIKAFAHYLRQEMSFFDHLENSSGAICNRLSSDGLAVQQMVGSYLGIVCESVATFGVGLVIGISGCGKSTVIQLLERFYDPMQGRICLDGVDIRQLNIQWLRSSLGLVSQEPILFNLTIAQNIAYGKENASIGDIIEAATKANIHHFIQQLSQVSEE
ncbi:unnamed protein product [Rotaria sordida]|uniref:Uncharacterized protein n=1 Tax=Rotaria sordida TaxID=392033 RepID=A0A814R631_9BILA|nr:unnamed protein product [Rotaria sordida]